MQDKLENRFKIDSFVNPDWQICEMTDYVSFHI